MFPKSLLIAFAVISIVANAGAIGHLAQKDTTWKQRANKGLEMAVKTPDKIDSFLAGNIKEIVNADNPSGKKVAMGMAFFALLSFVLMFGFFEKLLGWLLGLFRPPESEERAGLLTFILTVVLMFVLTRYTFISTIIKVV